MEIARNIFHLHKNSWQLQALKMFAACFCPTGNWGAEVQGAGTEWRGVVDSMQMLGEGGGGPSLQWEVVENNLQATKNT